MVATKNIEDVYPLSPMQAGMLFHSLLAPESGVYCEQISFELHGVLNVAAFAQAWQQVTARHPILRTAFVWENLEKPLQVVGKQVKFPWHEEDWRGVEPKEQQQKLADLLIADRQRGFELSQAPLMRLLLIRLSEQVYHFTWSHHHILLDGWSAPIIFQEVITYYKAFCQSKNIYLESPRPYRDYISWLQQQNLSQAEVFWRNILKGFTAPTPIGIKPITQHSTEDRKQQIKLSAATTCALQSLAKQHQLTLNTLVQGAWALLLNRYSGEEDIVFGATVSGRPPSLPKVEAMVGLFINTLPVRVQIDPEQFLLPWLKQLLAQQVEARQYEYTPLSDIQKWSDIPPGSPLFESIVVFENYPIENSLLELGIDLDIKNHRSFEKTNYPLTVVVVPGEELLLKIAYQHSDRLDFATIKRMLGHLQTLLAGMATNPHQRLKDLSLLTTSERHQLLIEWNNTEIDGPQDQCIHQLFEAQVEKTPDAVAVVFENQQLTYRELNTRANQLAHYLQTLGVGPEVLVGICVERSLEMVIGLLGILKAGGAYLPIDPKYPQERLSFMLQDSQTRLLLTNVKLLDILPSHQAKVICLDQDWQVISRENQTNLKNQVSPTNNAYTLYTSGSTGKPKAVVIEHRNTVAFLNGAKEIFPNQELTGVLASTSICFDLSIFELFVPLSSGGKVILIENILQVSSSLAAKEVTLINTVPSAIGELLKTNDIPNSVHTINLAGESLSLKLVQQLYEKTSVKKVFNLYGPSEDTTYSTFYLVKSEDDIVSIGRPITNTQIYILDSHLQTVPVGVAGEIYIGGVGVTRGYLNRPELTAEKFIPNLLSNQPGSRLYKTGDLARYLPDGNIEFLRRIDHQVKIRGFRIELGEIETVLNQHPDVQTNIVVVREDEPNLKRLVAYIVPNSDTEITTTDLQSYLKEKVAGYMIPSAFVILDKLPLTPNGKVDRQALPQPSNLRPELAVSYVKPQTEIEKAIATIWQQALNLTEIGLHDNFFEIGGHSLLAIQLIAHLRQKLQIEIPLQQIFASSTIAEQAAEIERLKSQTSNLEIDTIPKIDRDSIPDISRAIDKFTDAQIDLLLKQLVTLNYL